MYFTDDGSSPDKIAHVMGPPDRCEHAASIINELLQSIRVRDEEGQGVSVMQRIGGGAVEVGKRESIGGISNMTLMCVVSFPRVHQGLACHLVGVAEGGARGTGALREER